MFRAEVKALRTRDFENSFWATKLEVILRIVNLINFLTEYPIRAIAFGTREILSISCSVENFRYDIDLSDLCFHVGSSSFP